jgi:hypothetical protein
MSYDSTQDTLDHIARVEGYLSLCADYLRIRAAKHDASKLQEPEKSLYDEWTPKLRDMTYGSDEYKAALKEMGPALQHHYANNRHHPDFKKAKGGSVWQLYEDAGRFRHDGFKIYGVLARWGVDTQPNESGKWHDLLIDAPIVSVFYTANDVASLAAGDIAQRGGDGEQIADSDRHSFGGEEFKELGKSA